MGNSKNIFCTARLSSSEDALLINQLATNVLDDYNSFISRLILENKLTDLSLLLGPVCRNSLVSDVFHKFCLIAMFEEKLKRQKIYDEIQIDCRFDKNAFSEVCKKFGLSVPIVVAGKKKNITLKIFSNFLKTTYLAFSNWFWSRVFIGRGLPGKPFCYVDTFIFKESVQKGKPYIDRYFPGIGQLLSKKDYSSIRFVPTLFGVKYPWEYVKVMFALRHAQDQFIVKERLLTLGDYFRAIQLSVCLPFQIKRIPKFRGFNVRDIVIGELMEIVCSPALFRSICDYLIIERLAQRDTKVLGVVNWFENQSKDRALNLAFKKYFPTTLVKGYQAFMPIKNYPSLRPEAFERDLGTLPDILYVLNKHAAKDIRITCPKLPIKIGPSYRFSYLFNHNDRRDQGRHLIVAALPGSGFASDAADLLENIFCARDKLMSCAQILIKLHPTSSLSDIRMLKNVAKAFQNYEFTHCSICKLLEQADMVVSTASSVCVEAVSLGIPTAISGSRESVTLNPLPGSMKSELYVVFFDQEGLKAFLRNSLSVTKRTNDVGEWFLRPDCRNTKELFFHTSELKGCIF